MSIWDNVSLLDELEQQRAIKRKTDRLTFDCFNLRCKGDRVYCSKGKPLGRAKDGSMILVSVLRGVTSGICRDCEDFASDKEEL